MSRNALLRKLEGDSIVLANRVFHACSCALHNANRLVVDREYVIEVVVDSISMLALLSHVATTGRYPFGKYELVASV